MRGVNRPVPKGYSKHNADPEGAELSEIRPLTTIERSYVQTFPTDFKFFGTKTDLEQMIGNAVPVNLAKYVADSILEHVGDSMVVEQQINMFGAKQVFEVPERALHRDRA